MSAGNLTVKCKKVHSRFQLELNEEFSLEGITAIFGPSGAGKSSLLKLIAGLDIPDTGEITYNNTTWYSDHVNVTAQKREAGYLFQSGALFSHLTVLKNLLFAEKRSRHINNGITLEGVIEALGLFPLLGRQPQTLSGGERQRAALGRILLSRPKILLLDEPLTGLDRLRKRELLPLIRSLPEQFNLPCLYVSHDVDEVTAIADHLLVLKDGKTQAYGPTTKILNQVDTLPLSDLNIDPGCVFDTKVSDITKDMMVLKIGEAEFLLPSQDEIIEGQMIRLKIRSQDVSIATTRPKNISIQNCLGGRITQINPVFDTVFFDIEMKLDGGATNIIKSRITKQAKDNLNLTTGQVVFALIKTASLQR